VQLGNLSLSLLTGSVESTLFPSVTIRNSIRAFPDGQDREVGVELIPLLFSQQLMSRNHRRRSAGHDAQGSQRPLELFLHRRQLRKACAENAANSGSSSADSLSIGKLRLENGQITLGNTNSRKRTVYTKVNLTASDVAMKNNFPVLFRWNCRVAAP